MKSIVLFVICLFLPVLSWAGIIKKNDVLDIQVMSHPEFSGRFNVNSNGKLDYPLIADQTVENVSTSELMNELTFRLASHIDNPLVLVSIIENPEIQVTVLGQVVKPGPVKVFNGASIQEVLEAAGGAVMEKADLSNIKIIHHKSPDLSEFFNLSQFLKDGDVSKLPVLETNDMVIVLAQEKQSKVKVIGAVQKPGLFDITEKMNLFEAIYLAGGPSEKADLSRIRRLSSTSDNKVIEEVIDLQKYIDDGNMEKLPLISSGDVIIVYSRWFDWKTLLAILNNALLFVVTIQAFAGVFK
ncbi:MAG: hypothetical protein GX640_22420 [Fibrobacter sp.]|nr:hypothetical protein [Fibrobacter sp.]